MTRGRTLRLVAFGSAVVAIVAVVVVVTLAVTYVRRPLPEREGEVALSGLKRPVQVIRDEHGVPQVYADDATDLMRVQGYVHAQDRFFEMDLRRHITAGRLSELVGADDDALKADAVVRTLGWRRVAQQELEQLSPQVRSYLDAYADGVNDYLRDKSPPELSVSYTLLGRRNKLPRIEPWTPVDSLAWLKAMAWDLRSNYTEELERARAISTVKNVTRVGQLYPPYPYPEHPPIVPAREENGGGGTADTDTASPSLASPNVHRAAGAAPLDDAAERARQAGAAAGDAVGRATTAIQGQVAGGPATPTGSVEEALSSEPAQRAFDATAAAVEAVPRLLGHGDGVGSNSWVVSGDLTEHRQAAAGQRPPSRDLDAGDLVPDRACTAGRRRRSARSTSPGSASPACPGSSSATTSRSPGGSRTSTRTSPTSTWSA